MLFCTATLQKKTLFVNYPDIYYLLYYLHMLYIKQLLTLSTALLLGGCSVAVQDTQMATTTTQIVAEQKATTPEQLDPPQAYHQVSIDALAATELVGTDFTIGDVLARTDAYTRYYISYTSNGLTISGIMNVPVGNGPFPLLILNHGYIDPAIYTNGRGLKREQDYLARRGYVVIHTDYRNHAFSDKDPDTEYNFRLGYAIDSMNAIIAVRAAGLEYIDTEKVGMLGHSMGGGVTLNTLVSHPELVDAAVLFAPVSADNRRNFDKWTRSRYETAERILESYGEPEHDPEFWDGISAYNYFDAITAPVLLHHGTDDESVPLAWSDELIEWFDQYNVKYDYYAYDNEPHEFINAWPLVMQRTVDFFDMYLK